MTSVVKEGSLGSVLFKSKIITETDIEQALEEQRVSGCRFGEALVKLGIVTQEDIDWALSNQLNIPYVRLKKDMIDPGAVALVPGELARRFNLIPLICAGDELSIAIADPLYGAAIEAVERATGCKVSVSVGLIREIREMLDLLYGPATIRETLCFSSPAFSAEALEAINGDLTGGKLIDHLLLVMDRRSLAALSLQPSGDSVIITVRQGGKTRELGRLASPRYPDVVQRIRQMSGISNSADTTARGKIGFRSKERIIQFQVLLLRTMGGDYVTFKLNVADVFPETLAGFELAPLQEEAFASLLSARSGLLLFVMRDALERSRFLDLFLDQYDTAGKTVLMLGEGLGRGKKRFPRLPLHDWPPHDASSQIRAILEHDPDVIVIEEMNDSHAFLAASRGALRGKLVLAGVPWHGSEETIRHLFSFRHRNHFIVNIIKGMVGCTSVLTNCPHCLVKTEPVPEEAAALPVPPAEAYYRGGGCDSCDQTGFQEKKYLVEVIPFDRRTHDVFAFAADSGPVFQHLKERGEPSTRQQGDVLLNAGVISPEEYISSLIF